MLAPGTPYLAQQIHPRFNHGRHNPHHNHLLIRAGRARRGLQGMGGDYLTRQGQRASAARALNSAARHKKKRGQAALACEPEGAVDQSVVLGVDATSLQPNAGHFDVLQKMALLEGLAGMRQPQCRHVPAHEFGLGCQRHTEVVFSAALVVAKGLQRQPFKARLVRQGDVGALQRQRPG